MIRVFLFILLAAHPAVAADVAGTVSRLTQDVAACACTVDPASRDAGEKPLGRTSFKDLHGDSQAISVINDEFALKIFQQMTVQRKIPFGFPEDGCFSRAHEMSYQLQKQGILTGKIFATGQFRIDSEKAKNGSLTWSFHVAPFIIVDTGVGQEIWVIDPSLFEEPTSMQNWLAKLTEHPKSKLASAYLTSRFIYHPSGKDRKLSDFRKADLDDAHRVMRHYLEKEKKRDLHKDPDL